MTKIRIIAVLVGAVALILVILALQLLAPGDRIDVAGPDDAHIIFSADHAVVFAPGSCVTVRWQVDYIQAVYIDDVAAVGAGFKRACVDETTTPVLRVQFRDNTALDYQLSIDFLIFQPSTGLLVTAAILLGLTTLYVALAQPSASMPPAQGQRARRSTRVFAAVGMAVLALALTGIILEFSLRFYFTRYGSRAEQDAYVNSRTEIDVRENSQLVLPFVEYGLSPDYPGHNALGYRGDDIQVPKPDGIFRIVVMGDSSTYGTFVPYNQSFPYLLGNVLRDEYGQANVEVVNAGVPGYTSWNTFVALALRVTELQPDLVIIYEGGNDVLPREVTPDCYGAATPFLGLDPRRVIRAQPGELSPSTLYRFIGINLGWLPGVEQSENGVMYSRIACPPANKAEFPDYVAANPPVYFERNLRDMIGVANANDIGIMFSSLAYNPNASDREDYWQNAVDEHNAITARVAREYGTLYFDYAAVAPTERDLWNDIAHLTAEGNLSQAQAFAQFLIEQGIFGAPGE